MTRTLVDNLVDNSLDCALRGRLYLAGQSAGRTME